jgi:hypothetical protein
MLALRGMRVGLMGRPCEIKKIPASIPLPLGSIVIPAGITRLNPTRYAVRLMPLAPRDRAVQGMAVPPILMQQPHLRHDP